MSEHPPSGNGVPRHPDVRVEPKDVETGGVLWFLVGLTVIMLVSVVGLWGLLLWLDARAEAEKPKALPLAEQEQSEFRERTHAPVMLPLPEDKLNRWSDVNEAQPGSPRSRLAELPRIEGIDIKNPEHTTGRL